MKYIIGETKDYEIKAFANHSKKHPHITCDSNIQCSQY